MKETEKIEIMHFDQEGYLQDGRNVYEAGKRMTALADRVHEDALDANSCRYIRRHRRG